MCVSSMTASLELGWILFEIAFSMYTAIKMIEAFISFWATEPNCHLWCNAYPLLTPLSFICFVVNLSLLAFSLNIFPTFKPKPVEQRFTFVGNFWVSLWLFWHLMGIHHDDHSGNFLIVIAHAKHLFILSLAKKKGKIKAKLAIKKKRRSNKSVWHVKHSAFPMVRWV